MAAAAGTNDQRQALVAIRDDLARAMDECDPNVKPQIAAQLRATLADLRALPAEAPAQQPKGVVDIGEAKRRRADRKSGAADQTASAAGGRKRR